MSSNKKDFYGKEVTEAIRKACESLGVAQEKLDIEVIETGSTGIFGLIRKKAHIRVEVKADAEEDVEVIQVDEMIAANGGNGKKQGKSKTSGKKPPKADQEESQKQPPPARENTNGKPAEELTGKPPVPSPQRAADEQGGGEQEQQDSQPENEVSPEAVALVKQELLDLVRLMGFPSSVDIETKGLAVGCTLRGEFEEELAGMEGKVLDSLQYLLRKIIIRKVEEKVRISVDVGDFREKRLEELKVKAAELAVLAKEEGKTQVLPALNPSERRSIHMVLQEDKDIRSRSVGDGLFKKILIYTPGKRNRGPKKRAGSRAGQNKSNQKKK
ncbi:Jag family protein [Desulforhopalus singaporensis]|uniref:RNA-binding protein KhpB n=1 Tax=Desulforhopalus singaporensis TaxID=91360 RepID=A0A1H0JN71_9BACT|nr:Jag N-terminal domain-containing protein [Desulforhopalus singaporensis]SDO44992.1 spoIIIJ-associated protein [Desulforhopalus singaporensis]